MRIGFEITGALGGGGYRRYAESLLKALAQLDRSNEYFLYGAFWRGFPERALKISFPRQENFHWVLKRYPQGLLFPLEEFSGLHIQERVLSQLGLDVLHGLGSLLPRLGRLRSVVTFHYAGPFEFDGIWKRFYFNRLCMSSVQRAHKIIATSDFSRREILKSWAIPSEKVVTIHHGGAGPEFKPALERKDPMPGVARPYFLFVGSIHRPKNPALLAEAFGIFKKQYPGRPHHLVWAGPGGDQLQAVKEILRSWNVDSEAAFLGSVDPQSIPPLFQQAEALVHPSLQEGFALPVVEAMACGVPVLGARAGALVEIIGEAGLLAEPNPEAFAQEMLRIVSDHPLREELKRRGLERCRQFSWEDTAKRTLEVYREVCAAQ